MLSSQGRLPGSEEAEMVVLRRGSNALIMRLRALASTLLVTGGCWSVPPEVAAGGGVCSTFSTTRRTKS